MDNYEFKADTPLTDAELAQLDGFLQSGRTPEATLWIDELDGFFAALLCGPRLVPPSEWLAAVWNGEDPQWTSEGEAQGIIALMMRHWNAVARGIDTDEYEPIMRYQVDDAGNEVDDPAGWCYGFIEGVSMWRVEDWENEELRTLITPMVALRDEDPEDEEDDNLAEMMREPGMRERLIDMLPDAVDQLREYWKTHPSPEGGSMH